MQNMTERKNGTRTDETYRKQTTSSRFKSNHIKNEFKHKWFKKVNRKTDCLDKCIWMAESLCCSPETITTLLISCTPVQNKKLKQKTKKQTVT